MIISKTYIWKRSMVGQRKKNLKMTRMVVTAADKKANTKAYQNYESR